MGEAAAAHVRTSRETEATARGYEVAIDRTLALVRDPARKAMAIWGKSLVDVGINEEMVAEGYGMEYALPSSPWRAPDGNVEVAMPRPAIGAVARLVPPRTGR